MPRPAPILRKLTAEGAPESARPWVESLLVRPLNTILDTLQSLLNRGISLPANANTQFITVDVVAPSAWDATTYIRAESTLTGRCQGLSVVRVVLLDSAGKESAGSLGTTVGAPEWDEQAPTKAGEKVFIRVRRQSGLNTGQAYRVTWMAIGE